MIARETDCGVYLNAGREVAVASTNLLQVSVLYLHSLLYGLHKIKVFISKKKAIHDLRNFFSIEFSF